MSHEWTSIPTTWRAGERPGVATSDPDAPLPDHLSDGFGRVIRNMRVSVTDRCNFRCVYCMPEEMTFYDRSEVLTFGEIERFTRIAVRLGIRKVRLTGGEPLVRRQLPRLVKAIGEIEGVEDLALTTNGVRLDELAGPLRDAGLHRLNVSLDTMDRDLFAQLTRRDALHAVLDGIDAALEAGFTPLKVNVVAMAGISERELIDFARLARERPIVVRFIEYMPLDGDGAWDRTKLLSRKEILSRINAVYPLEPVDGRGSSPSEDFAFVDGRGRIGIIASVTDPFCDRCDRIRLTADGKLRTCLFAVQETDFREMLRDGSDDDRIARALVNAVAGKERGHMINVAGFVRPDRNMSRIGG
ncbi:GTP 3',8-cyclase MoaA [Candidatus Poribacteria bacterium]|nr:GTP 3',8-cyclase MoaA [Candidatus Poribacteria bacterium]